MNWTMPYWIATFYCEYDALIFEKQLKARSIPVQLMPVPRALSSSCGIAARFPQSGREAVDLLVNAGEVTVDQLHWYG